MKNKRLIIFLFILGFFAFLVVLASTVFSVKIVSVNFLSTTSELTGEEDNIVSVEALDLGSNIFFVDKTEAIEEIENANPYIEVISIETVFPDRLVVHAIEREEVYAIKMDDNNYAICDSKFKVLKIESSLIDDYIILDGYEGIDATIVNESDYINLTDSRQSIIEDTLDNLLMWDNNIVNIKSNIKEIEFDYEMDNQIRIEMQTGVNIVIKDANEMIGEKIVLGISLYETDMEDYHSGGVILVIKEVDDTISAVYSPQNV